MVLASTVSLKFSVSRSLSRSRANLESEGGVVSGIYDVAVMGVEDAWRAFPLVSETKLARGRTAVVA